MTYMKWCRAMERQYERMPPWFWKESKARKHYERYLQQQEELYDHQCDRD